MAFPSRLGAVCLPIALAACAAPSPPTIYTLMTAPAPLTSSTSSDSFVVQTQPVSLPPQVDQPQLVLRTSSEALVPLDGDRWAAPLADELQTAFSAALTQRLGVPDVGALGASGGLPTWRVQMDVQRFELPVQGPTVLDATWRIRRDRGPALLCRSVVEITPVGSGLAPLVEAQQQAVIRLAQTVALAIEAGARSPAAVPGVTLSSCARTEGADSSGNTSAG